MTNRFSDEFLSSLKGGVISQISRTCDMVSIRVDLKNAEVIFIHIQSFFRIIKNNKVIISSEDIFQCDKCYDNCSFEWDIPGQSVFDNSIKEHQSELCDLKIIEMNQNSIGKQLFVANSY